MTASERLHKRRNIRRKYTPIAEDDKLLKSASHKSENLQNPSNLSPSTLIRLQSTVGNHAVQRMLKQNQSGTIQRDPKEDFMTTGENILGHVSNVGDIVGNEKGFNISTPGNVLGTVGGVGGMGLGAFKVGVHGRELSKVSTELNAKKELAKSEDGLHATITLLERKKAAAQKGIAEGSGTIIGGISGFMGSVAGFFSSATAQTLSHVMGPIGAGLGVLLGTIAAIRDFMNVHKRRKAKEAINVVIGGYADVASQLNDQLRVTKGKVDSLDTKDTDYGTKLAALSNEVAAIETKIDGVDKMRIGLAVAKRKQGSKGKIMSGLTNLLGVAGGGALLALGIGAMGVAGVGAAAGPVGWALVAAAAVAALSYFIGMKIKQSIRASNVKRMNEEIGLVNDFIATGKVNGAPIMAAGTDATTLSADQRLKLKWQRSWFPTAETKGWFNKLISKSKSGKITIEERKQELTDYLAKYDKDSAAGNVWEGFKKALAPGEEGDMMVDNPKYDAKKAPSEPQKITLREQITGLIEFNFPGKSAEFVKSINAGGDKEQNARSLLMQKMKLEDK